MSMTKRGSVKSSFLRVIQFRRKMIQDAFNWNKSKPILPFFVRLLLAAFIPCIGYGIYFSPSSQIRII